jgi:hypothetical protein
MADQMNSEEQEKAEKKRYKAEKQAAELRLSLAKAAEAEAKLQRAKDKSDTDDRNAQGMFGTPAEPRKSMSTYLRNQNKFEVSVISILDKKASILIKICSTFISVLIAFSGYIDKNVASGKLLSLVLAIGLIVTLVLSLLSAKPFTRKIDKMVKKKILLHYPALEENNFLLRQECTVQEYEGAMRKVVGSQDLQLGNQIRANYIIAQANVQKSRLVDYAYSVFLLTFLVTSTLFLLNRFGLIAG